jgi:hypothetical protein
MPDIIHILAKEIEEKTGLTLESMEEGFYIIKHNKHYIIISIITGTTTFIINHLTGTTTFIINHLLRNDPPSITLSAGLRDGAGIHKIDLNHPQSIDTIIQTINTLIKQQE